MDTVVMASAMLVISIPMMIVTVPCGLVSVMLVRRLARVGGRIALGSERETA
jgi:hypothetical protein